jgi:hypothetical protein
MAMDWETVKALLLEFSAQPCSAKISHRLGTLSKYLLAPSAILGNADGVLHYLCH